MNGELKIGTIRGVDLALHFSWILIALLITLSLGTYFGTANPDWSAGIVWGTAVLTGLLFFASIVVHELAHALVAQASGLPVRSITLFALGGLARIDREAASAKHEFWMAIAGPIASVAIGIACLTFASLLGWSPDSPARTPMLATLVWLGYINLVLAAFNMVPGFPLDGGRVLRAVIWWITGDADTSTKRAAQVGQVVALALIAFGLLRLFTGAGFAGLWLAFIGWFLLQAASASAAQVEARSGLRDVRVADLMSRDCLRVDGRETVQQFVDDHLLRSGRRCYLIERAGRTAGLVTPNEVRQVDRSRWHEVRIEDAMRPIEQLETVRPETPAATTLEIMARHDVNQLPVMVQDRVDGIVTRGHILQYLRNRAELEA